MGDVAEGRKSAADGKEAAAVWAKRRSGSSHANGTDAGLSSAKSHPPPDHDAPLKLSAPSATRLPNSQKRPAKDVDRASDPCFGNTQLAPLCRLRRENA
jgi:hypothetical protein